MPVAMGRRAPTAAGLALIALAVLLSPPVWAESGRLNLHLEPGVGAMVLRPQSQLFGLGFNGALKVDVRVAGPFSALLVGSWSLLTSPVFRTAGQALELGGGVRVRLLDDQHGYLFHLSGPGQHQGNLFGNLWIDATVQYVRTGLLDRVGFSAGVGVELSLIDGLQLGPFLKYSHILQPDTAESLDKSDASMLVGGISFSFGFPSGAVHSLEDGLAAPAPAPVPAAAPLPPPPPPPAPAVPVATLKGRVLDLDEKPLKGVVRVRGGPAHAPWKPLEASPDFETQLEPGEYFIEAEVPGHLVRGRQLNLKGNETTVIDLFLRPVPQVTAAVLTKQRIELRQVIRFETNNAGVLPHSFFILDEVADILLRNPALRIRIEGHTDEVGTAGYNLQLSESRVLAVMEYLIDSGVAIGRLEYKGFGKTRPIASNKTETGRARNRRVQFEIIE